MKLHELAPTRSSTKTRKRKGRGPGTGNGKTAGRGHKGLLARSGGGVRPDLREPDASCQASSEARFVNKFANSIPLLTSMLLKYSMTEVL